MTAATKADQTAADRVLKAACRRAVELIRCERQYVHRDTHTIPGRTLMFPASGMGGAVAVLTAATETAALLIDGER